LLRFNIPYFTDKKLLIFLKFCYQTKFRKKNSIFSASLDDCYQWAIKLVTKGTFRANHLRPIALRMMEPYAQQIDGALHDPVLPGAEYIASYTPIDGLTADQRLTIRDKLLNIF
jgi:hypothetical protein